ncbi:hypothetical protein RFZ44_21450, partial [Acinetobacter sp. 163]|nr:hypothetical protein [Acinetobacter sp. 163]
MFWECSKLQSVNLSSFRTPKLTSLNSTFELCSSLRTLDLSEVIAFHIARERVHSQSVEEAVLRTARKLKGAYGLVIM